ncbi:predicted protein [Lichtheimia corymbifera JMRC:FSU:9682]|uniref:Uncharacterized protein n=1 Tax=Lichtheimia corymbifera JMRC:FSU:9682 TaxID=1263082 RepID=A0A068S107_9FUNG|nr:predicted protein [Lichtheimia corymbifera JMRC:FSU:9682]
MVNQCIETGLSVTTVAFAVPGLVGWIGWHQRWHVVYKDATHSRIAFDHIHWCHKTTRQAITFITLRHGRKWGAWMYIYVPLSIVWRPLPVIHIICDSLYRHAAYKYSFPWLPVSISLYSHSLMPFNIQHLSKPWWTASVSWLRYDGNICFSSLALHPSSHLQSTSYD